MIAVDEASIDILRKRWIEKKRFAPFYPYLTITDEGLLLGAGTILAPMQRNASGTPSLAVEGREGHVLAMLSLGFQKAVSITSLKAIEPASQQWAKGEKTLAHMELAFARLPKFQSPEETWLLFCADALVKDGLSPRALMKAVGIETSQIDLFKYAYDQPRVPAGNGRASGQWTSGGGGSPPSQATASAHSGEVMSDANPDPIKPGQQYAQSVIVKDLPSGTPIEPYKELTRSFNELPRGSKQVLQYRFFVQDDKTGLWHLGMEMPPNSEVRLTTVTRGQGAGIDQSGFIFSPPGSPPLPDEGSVKNPISGVRYGIFSTVTGQPYIRVFNDQGQPISPVTGRTVDRLAPEGHYPTDPHKFQGPF